MIKILLNRNINKTTKQSKRLNKIFKIKKYNSVMKLKICLNNLGYIKDIKNMAYQNTIAKTEVRDLLTQEELRDVQQLRGIPLICIWKKSKKMSDNSGFAGYFPLNAPINTDHLTPHRLDDQSLDILKDFCSGG